MSASRIQSLMPCRQTEIDLSDIPGAPATIETSWLQQSRFAEGKLIKFDSKYPTPTAELV